MYVAEIELYEILKTKVGEKFACHKRRYSQLKD